MERIGQLLSRSSVVSTPEVRYCRVDDECVLHRVLQRHLQPHQATSFLFLKSLAPLPLKTTTSSPFAVLTLPLKFELK